MKIYKVSTITGAVASGKSRFALEMALGYGGIKTFIATAIPFDDEMRNKIERHRGERGKAFQTVEAPVNLVEAIQEAQIESSVIVVDCVTVWLNNLFHQDRGQVEKFDDQIQRLIEVLSSAAAHIILVTNEVGWGVMPENALARRYADALGRLNQRIASVSDEVVMVIAGIPQWVKGGRNNANMD
jgi:adenosylcobinamide kinase/adenosylcobinamide-phosphate guanylyltransferase